MICEKCKDKPLIRGIQKIECCKCGKDKMIMYGNFNICVQCSDKRKICERCGEKIKWK